MVHVSSGFYKPGRNGLGRSEGADGRSAHTTEQGRHCSSGLDDAKLVVQAKLKVQRVRCIEIWNGMEEAEFKNVFRCTPSLFICAGAERKLIIPRGRRSRPFPCALRFLSYIHTCTSKINHLFPGTMKMKAFGNWDLWGLPSRRPEAVTTWTWRRRAKTSSR